MTPHLWPLRSYLELGALPTAVPCARLHARHLLWEWGLNGLAANTELLTSELVTNAVQATAGQQQAAIRLRLSSDGARVLVEVWDADPQLPAPKALGEDGTPDPQEEGGRGLFLVAALSARWDWYLTEDPAGKVVWCELQAELSSPTEAARSRQQTKRQGFKGAMPRRGQLTYGVVDEIARRVWLSGGRVLAVRRDDVPGRSSVAAILRYPL